MDDSLELFKKTNQFMKSLMGTIDRFCESNDAFTSGIKSNLKDSYDYCKRQEIESNHKDSLPELIIQNFDDEQIWQQLELQNNSVLENAVIKVGLLLSKKNNLAFQSDESTNETIVEPKDNGGGGVEEDAEIENEQNESEIEEMDTDDCSQDEESEVRKSTCTKKSVVDDQFFKLHEMEEFLEMEEKKMNVDSGHEQGSDQQSDEGSEDSIDLFDKDSESEEDNVRLAKYRDFFVQKVDENKKKERKYSEELSDSQEDGEVVEKPSTFELRQGRLDKKIEKIESNAIAEKPWQLQGEIKADNRPINSLLEEVVEFDRTTRPAPVLTGHTTLLLEDIIKQRIKDKVFDSVERKVKPVITPFEYKKNLVLDQEKSKLSLAQIYEKEYLDQKAALDPENAEKEEEEPELHKEVRSMMASLFQQLDALSNYHYTPKAAIPELKIISNIPAINMEEVAPVGTSDAALLAPEEVKKKPKTEILGKSEMTVKDKNRARRKKKSKQRYHAQEKAKSLKKIDSNVSKISKKNANELLEKISKEDNVEKMDESLGKKSVKSSTTFFKQLEEHIQLGGKSKVEKKNKSVKYNVKKMKL